MNRGSPLGWQEGYNRVVWKVKLNISLIDNSLLLHYLSSLVFVWQSKMNNSLNYRRNYKLILSFLFFSFYLYIFSECCSNPWYACAGFGLLTFFFFFFNPFTGIWLPWWMSIAQPHQLLGPYHFSIALWPWCWLACVPAWRIYYISTEILLELHTVDICCGIVTNFLSFSEEHAFQSVEQGLHLRSSSLLQCIIPVAYAPCLRYFCFWFPLFSKW